MEHVCDVCGVDKREVEPCWDDMSCSGCGRYKSFCERLGEGECITDDIFDLVIMSPLLLIGGFLVLCFILAILGALFGWS